MDLKRNKGKRRTLHGRPAAPVGDNPWDTDVVDESDSRAPRTGSPTRATQPNAKQPVHADTSTMRRPASRAVPAGPPVEQARAKEYQPIDGEDGGIEARAWIDGRWLPVGVIVIGARGVRVRLGGPPPALDELIVAVRTSPSSGLIVQMREVVVETRRDARGTILNLRHRELHCPAPCSQLRRFLADVLGIPRPHEEGFRAEGRGVYYDFASAPARQSGLVTTDDFIAGSEPQTAVRANPLAAFQRKGQ